MKTEGLASAKCMQLFSRIPNPTFILCIFMLLFAVAVSSCSQPEEEIYGTYKLQHAPNENQFVIGQEAQLQVNKDNSIVYTTTLNNQPKFRFLGTFTREKGDSSLLITWKEGKLPRELQVQKRGPDTFIQIGTSKYVKENPLK